MSLAFRLRYNTFSRSIKRLPKLSGLSSRRSRCTITVSQSASRRVVFQGTPQITAIALKKLYYASGSSQPNYEVNGVVTQPPSSQGRKRVLTKSPVHALAKQIGLSPILTPPDFRISAAYGNFLPKQILDLPKFSRLNIRPSLLAEFCGAAPVSRALEAGVQKTGVSVHCPEDGCRAGTTGGAIRLWRRSAVANSAENVRKDFEND
ncbi:Formyl transferase [Gracilaria domingensis]|nr:Formyl transferase [Gracilaria domingensis]